MHTVAKNLYLHCIPLLNCRKCVSGAGANSAHFIDTARIFTKVSSRGCDGRLGGGYRRVAVYPRPEHLEQGLSLSASDIIYSTCN